MGYRVEYGKNVTFPGRSGIRAERTVLMTLVFGTLFLAWVCKVWPEGTRVLEELIVFDELHRIHGFLETLAIELRSGTSFGEAVATFCQDIIALGITNAA